MSRMQFSSVEYHFQLFGIGCISSQEGMKGTGGEGLQLNKPTKLQLERADHFTRADLKILHDRVFKLSLQHSSYIKTAVSIVKPTSSQSRTDRMVTRPVFASLLYYSGLPEHAVTQWARVQSTNTKRMTI